MFMVNLSLTHAWAGKLLKNYFITLQSKLKAVNNLQL
jgi:hypothetical protein